MQSEVRDGLSARRQQVLQLLRVSETPMRVMALAEHLGVHSNTVRYHLSALEEDGRVERVPSVAAGRGRPEARYRVVPDPGRGDRRYELLASILIGSLGAGVHAREAASRAGMAWGRRHAERSDGEDLNPIERLVAYLGEVGFAPHRTEARIIELHNCPFREVFDEQGDVVCAVHAGLMRGTLDSWGAETIGTDLEPLVRPGVCRVRLASTGVAA